MRRWTSATKVIPQVSYRCSNAASRRSLSESAEQPNGRTEIQVNEAAEKDSTATDAANDIEISDSQPLNAVLPQLPLSPLTSPALQAARNRYQAPKPAPSGEPSAFQKRLSKNPYGMWSCPILLYTRKLIFTVAQALATPVRSCSVTGARLPSYFLLDFGLAPYPKTGKPWEMPKLSVDADVVAERIYSQNEEPAENKAGSKTAQASSTDTSNAKGKIVRTVPASYVSCQKLAVGFKSRLTPKSYMQLVPYRWKKDPRIKASEIIWRKDMDAFVLDLMRRKTTRLLKYLSLKPAAYIVQCNGYQEVKAKQQAAAALWLGNPTIQPLNKIEQIDDKVKFDQDDKSPPPFYAMMEYRSRHIPVYNLPTLLGPNYLRQLQDSIPTFKGEMAIVKQKYNTTAIQMELWRLMGYLAFPKDDG